MKHQLPYLGEILSTKGIRSGAVLPCSFAASQNIQVIVQDNLGRAFITKSFDVDEATSKLEFDTSRLKSGNYHVWIYMGDQQFIRNFTVESKAQKKSGLIQQIFKIFS
ncbi:MAG: hypothetical protein MUC59_05800 [Saprospiraceae bacterium]|jgi:hypothetical protein|nr:hypothetical protein [Saprospiraceae bacterium]